MNEEHSLFVSFQLIMKSTHKTIHKNKNPSKETKYKKQKQLQQALALQNAKPRIYKVLGTYQTHRLYGDLVFTDELFDLSSPIYTFQLCTKHKILRQIHVRSHGVVLEFEELDEKYISCIEFIKSRLFSLGNKDVLEFCETLDHYKNFFTKKTEGKKPVAVKNENFDMMAYFDGLFLVHKEDLLFVRGSKFLNDSSDFRTKYLGFNFNLIEWITDENNYCLRIFPMKSHDEFSNIMSLIMGKPLKNVPKRTINTILGEIERSIDVKMTFLPNSIFLHYMLFQKEKSDPLFTMQLKCFRSQQKQKKKSEVDRSNVSMYFNLMKSYYPKPD